MAKSLSLVLLAIGFTLGTPSVVRAQDPHLAVIVGLAGEPEDGETFHKWATTLVDTAQGRFGIARERVVFLSEKPDLDPKRITGRSTRDEIAKHLGTLAASAGETDPVFIVLIGHGTADTKAAKFNLPGPDMTAAEFAPLLAKFKSKRVVLVNTTSASGPFIEALSAPGRTIVTATRNASERFTTIFGGFFVDALAEAKADADKNGRISVLEAFDYARREVANAYEREGIMATEHALLDDSGDREGTMTPAADGKQGRIAAMISLGAPTGADPLPADPKLRALHEERRALERRVEALKLLKGSMDPQKYSSELESVLTELALKTRQIREAEKK